MCLDPTLPPGYGTEPLASSARLDLPDQAVMVYRDVQSSGHEVSPLTDAVLVDSQETTFSIGAHLRLLPGQPEIRSGCEAEAGLRPLMRPPPWLDLRGRRLGRVRRQAQVIASHAADGNAVSGAVENLFPRERAMQNPCQLLPSGSDRC